MHDTVVVFGIWPTILVIARQKKYQQRACACELNCLEAAGEGFPDKKTGLPLYQGPSVELAGLLPS